MPIPVSGIGFNFRSTLGFVTDGTREFFANEATAYPTTFGSAPDDVVAGWVATTSLLSRDRNAGVDRRCAGLVFNDSGVAGNFNDWRVDVPAGTYTIRVALTDQGINATNPVLTVRDGVGGTVLATVSNGTLLAAGEVRDASGADRATVAAWVSSNASISVTTTGTVMAFRLGPIVSGGNSTIAHIQIIPVASGSITVDAPETNTIVQGGTLNVPIAITRAGGFTGDVTITATGLSTGVTAGALTILSGSTTGTLVLTATGGATIVTDDAWQVVASGSGVSNATDDVLLTVTAAPTGTAPIMGEGAVVAVQPIAPAAPEPVPFVAVSATTGAALTTAVGITIRYKKPGAGTWTDKTATYDGEAGCFTWTPDAADVDTQGRGRFVVGGTAARVSYNLEVVGPDHRQSIFRAAWTSLDSFGWSPLKYVRTIFATTASFLTGAQTGTASFRNPTNTATWVQGPFDASGNRNDVTFTAPNDL